jgi:hypothetical protein
MLDLFQQARFLYRDGHAVPPVRPLLIALTADWPDVVGGVRTARLFV